MKLIPVTSDPYDIELIRSWRSNPDVYAGFYTQKSPLSWEEHFTWWESRPSSWHEFFIEIEEKDCIRPIGVICIGQTEYWEPEIGIMIGNPTDWGKGYGKESVTLALGILKEMGKRFCRTTILDNNLASKELFTRLGFERIADARPGESLYRKCLDA